MGVAMASKRQARKCSGHRTDGQPCGAYAVNGARVCSAHGGQAPQVKAKAEERIAEERIRKELARLDVVPVDDYLGQIALIAGQVIAWKDALAGKVNALSSLRYEGTRAGEQLRAEVALWERALDRCERFLSAMARMNIEERMAKVTEAQAAMAQKALLATLGEMGFTPQQQRDAQARLGRHLRAVS
jgi:hypothetical protein